MSTERLRVDASLSPYPATFEDTLPKPPRYDLASESDFQVVSAGIVDTASQSDFYRSAKWSVKSDHIVAVFQS